MAKHTCAICGAEVNLLSGQKLADGNYICRKVCGKKCFNNLDKVSAHLSEITEHFEQIEKGTRIWNEVLLPLKESKNKAERPVEFGTSGGADLYVSASTGLVALVETHYKFFIFGKYQKACVYRIGDIASYEYFEEEQKNSEGKVEKKHFMSLIFDNTPGLAAFNLQLSTQKACEKLEKCLNEIFGIQKTLKNSFNNAKRQLEAIKSVAGAVKSAAQGNLDEETVMQAMDDVGTYVRGDRTEILAKADAVLAKFK
ncbi:MAG: DUF4428 domain-containing protein [Clostridiales bacterium]|nr:DUF4428 domain-containing protein [Clostridiales bacterium]